MTNVPPPGAWSGYPTQPRPTAPAPAPKTPSKTPLIVLSALLVVFVAATAVFAGLYFTSSGSKSDDSAAGSSRIEDPAKDRGPYLDRLRTEATQVAENAAATLSSHDYRNPELFDRAAVMAFSTPEFNAKHERAATEIRGVLVPLKSRTTSVVKTSAISEIDDQTATVLVAVTTTTTTVQTPAGTTQSLPMVVKLQRHDNRWLVADLETF